VQRRPCSTLEYAPRSSFFRPPPCESDNWRRRPASAATRCVSTRSAACSRRGAARRGSNGYREYPQEAAQWLGYIRTAQSLGFTLAEIEADLPLVADPDASAPALRDALRRKLDDIDRRVQGLAALREELARRLDEAMSACPLRPAVVAIK
jgi:DNA-binding transcriptional MerR regulator